MFAGDVGVFAGDADARLRGEVGAAGAVARFGDRDAAMADVEIERGVNLRVVELHQHVAAADAELGGAEGNEGGDIEGADPDHVQFRMISRKAQAPAALIGVVGGRNDAGGGQQRAAFVQNSSFGQGQHDRHGRGLNMAIGTQASL